MARIYADPDQFTQTLRTLLDLSDNPRLVKVVEVKAIEVPDEVAERYLTYQMLDESTVDEESVEQPTKRRPGRPRKNPLPEE